MNLEKPEAYRAQLAEQGLKHRFLKSGVINASFQALGKQPTVKEEFMRWVITGSNKSKQSATKDVGMAPRAQYFLAEAIP